LPWLSSASERRRRERRGRAAERIALWYFRIQGYRLLARRFRTPVGEIDLVLRRGGTVVFVEVKFRSREREEVLDARQQHRIARAALLFLRQRPELMGHGLRFDLLLLSPFAPPRHLPDAWRPEAGTDTPAWSSSLRNRDDSG